MLLDDLFRPGPALQRSKFGKVGGTEQRRHAISQHALYLQRGRE
jgi:hypothetical protein